MDKKHMLIYGGGGVAVLGLAWYLHARSKAQAAQDSSVPLSMPVGVDTPLTSYPMSGGMVDGGSSGGGLNLPSIGDITGSTSNPLADLLAAYLAGSGNNSNTGVNTGTSGGTTGGTSGGTTGTNSGTSNTGGGTTVTTGSSGSLSNDAKKIYAYMYSQGYSDKDVNSSMISSMAGALGMTVNQIGAAFGLDPTATSAWMLSHRPTTVTNYTANSNQGTLPVYNAAPGTVVDLTTLSGSAMTSLINSVNNFGANSENTNIISGNTVTTLPSADVRSKVYAQMYSDKLSDADLSTATVTRVAGELKMTPIEVGQAFGMSHDQAQNWLMTH